MTRVIDLSHHLLPGKQRFTLELRNRPVEEYLPTYHASLDEWYIMGDLELCTHVGTHVEAPFHAIELGAPVSSLDLRALIGPAAIIDIREKRDGEAVTVSELTERSQHLRAGDIALLCTGRSRSFGTAEYRRPYLERAAVAWLVSRGVKAVGVDCSGIENRAIDSHEVNHRILFEAGIPLMEDLNNLDRIGAERCFFLALTLPVVGLDASPIRPLAVEPESVGEQLASILLSPSATWEGTERR